MPASHRAGAIALVLLFLASYAAAADHATYIQPIEKTLPAAGVTQVVLQNLVGPVTIEAKPDGDIHLVVLVHAGGPDQTFARTLAGQLTFSTEQTGGQLRITGQYPLDHFRDYGYPRMKSIMGIHGTDSNEYLGQKVFIRNAGAKRAVELWAEVRLTVPDNLALVIRNIYGDVEVRGGAGAGATGSFDGFTDVGDFTIYRPRWAQMTLQSNYGKVEFTDGLGATQDIHVNTQFGGTYLDLPPNAQGKIVARKDLGFLHNDVTNAKFSKDDEGDSVLQLGDGNGPVVHIDMSVGSLHLRKIGQ